ncbi:MAG TPA: hypothetical protein VK507_11990, partial [Iamia sp.]|nr:hypothetical protein [Iamia sp.]
MTTTDIGAPARPAAASAPAPGSGAAPWWERAAPWWRRAAPWWRLAAPGLVIGALTAWYRLGHRGLWLDEAYTLGSTHQLRSAVPDTSWTM